MKKENKTNMNFDTNSVLSAFNDDSMSAHSYGQSTIRFQHQNLFQKANSDHASILPELNVFAHSMPFFSLNQNNLMALKKAEKKKLPKLKSESMNAFGAVQKPTQLTNQDAKI